MRSFVLAIILLFAGASAAVAQDSYRGDAAATYEWVHANAGPGQCGCFGLNGGGISGSWNFHGPWSAVVDFSAGYANNAPTAGSSLTLTSYLAGARYKLPQPWLEGKHKPEPFAQVLIGGGIDVPLSSRFAVRVIQIDYYLTNFTNSTNNHQNNLLVAAGFVFHWSR
jgi:outer membrane immunogenic protein